MMKATALLVFAATALLFVGVFYFFKDSSIVQFLNQANARIGLVPVSFDYPISTACFGAAQDFCGPGAGIKNSLINGFIDAGILATLVFTIRKFLSVFKVGKT
jgi:hypothetical protein